MPKIVEPLKKLGQEIKNRLTRKQVPVPGGQRDIQDFGDDSGNPVRQIPITADEARDNQKFRKIGPKDKIRKKIPTSDGYMVV